MSPSLGWYLECYCTSVTVVSRIQLPAFTLIFLQVLVRYYLAAWSMAISRPFFDTSSVCVI